LREKNILYIILEHDVKIVDKAIASGEEAIFLANAAQKMVLAHFNINDSIAIIVTIENAIQLQLVCENIVSFDAGVHSIVKVDNAKQKVLIENIGINHVLDGKALVSKSLMAEALVCHLNK